MGGKGLLERGLRVVDPLQKRRERLVRRLLLLHGVVELGSQIRDLFFAGGGNQPTVRFEITPLDTDAKLVTLNLDSQAIIYAHGPQRPVSVTWPGQINSVRLVFDPPPSSGEPVLQAKGPWALLRLFSEGRLAPTNSADRYTVTFQLGDRHISYEISAGSVLNPLAPDALRDFQCPTLTH